MAFKQGVRPVLVVAKGSRKVFRGDLLSTGYKPHTGPRSKRGGEIQAWVNLIGRDRQVHVQEQLLDDGSIAVFAHTEPAGTGLEHLISAILDRASYSGGARVLLADLRSRGWNV
jgi:hypothetical protein